MNLGELAIRKKTITFVMTALLVVGGIISFGSMSRLEDPEFTIKDALIITPYPGATATEVEEEVSDVIEKAVQQLGQLKRVTSQSERGLSTVTATIKDKYDKESLPQVWDELRRKVNDAQGKLPPGAGPSFVNDDYGDVFGVYIAVTGEEYSYAELKKVVDLLERELLLVKDVKKISLYGVQPEVVYVEMSRPKMATLGITQEQIYSALVQKNIVADAGNVKVGTDYITIDPSGAFTSEEQFGDLLISSDSSGRLIYLKDVATIRRGYAEPPDYKLRFDGKAALGLSISTVGGGNVVEMGDALARRFKELQSQLPLGVEVGIIALQSEAVTKSINGFVVNLLEAVIIVIVVLLIFMGLRCGLLIGAVLFITICGSFIVMSFYEIILQRISLGALIIALGMLVDNAIVITDGILIKIERGVDRVKAAGEVVAKNMTPLLGATAIAVLAFGAIGLSQDSTGEYCRSLFQVLLISLLMSWVTAVTITPLFCVMFLKAPPGGEGKDPYGGTIFRVYKGFLRSCLRRRRATFGVMAILLIIACYGYGFIDKSFFPASTRPQFMIDFWLPRGTHLEVTGREVKKVEEYLMGLEGVEHVTSFVGKGGDRFLLVYAPEKPDSGYAQFLVNVDDYRKIEGMAPEIQQYLEENFPDAMVNVKKFLLGPGGGGKIQVRFSGPDPVVLRDLAGKTEEIMHEDGGAKAIRGDWRQMVKVLRPVLSEAQARRAGIDRPALATALQAAFDGTTVGVYRERDILLPIISRAPEYERANVDSISNLQIWSPVAGKMIPLRQIISRFDTVFENDIMMRRNRRPTITVHCDQREGNASILLERIMPKIEAIPLPPDYMLEWGGEYEDSSDAQAAIAGNLPFFLLLMVLIIIFLFNALRQPLIILLCVPFALIGVTLGLLVTRQPFGFMPLLGTLSLTGMLIKNAIVLVDETDLEIREGKQPFSAIMDSAISRMRPVLMAAATTALGMIPLLTDAFFIGMAVTIMVGLSFASVLTLILVPVLYATFFRIPSPERKKSVKDEKEDAPED